MKRNLSPRDITLLLSFFLTLILATILIINTIHFKWVIISCLFFFALTYLFTSYLIVHFIHNKIKLVYKTIHHLKSKKDYKPDSIFSKKDLIENVNLDVTQWAVEQEKQMTLLKDQEKYRREFLANIGHELKTPIFSIQGYLHTLLDGAIEDKEVNLKFMQKAAKNADRLQELVEDLMSISKIEKGDIELNPSKFDICELSKGAWERLELLHFAKETKLKIKEGCDRPYWVNADKDELLKVLENLLSNSIKYGKNQGQITLAFYEMGNNILTEITDDGEGINEKDLPRLFERFYRADKSRSRDMGGTGLGLSIVKHIIESHEQTINVRSALGIGTTFGFTLSKAR